MVVFVKKRGAGVVQKKLISPDFDLLAALLVSFVKLTVGKIRYWQVNMGCCCSVNSCSLKPRGSEGCTFHLRRRRVAAKFPAGRLCLPTPSSSDALQVSGDLAVSVDRLVVVTPPTLAELCAVCSRRAACHKVLAILLQEGNDRLTERKLTLHTLSLVDFSIRSERLRFQLRVETAAYCDARAEQVDALHDGDTIVDNGNLGNTWCGHL